MADEAPPWLVAMRAITGLTENEGSGSNPRILAMADFIGKKYPEQASYAANYTSDDIAWCGLTVGFVMAVADVEPVFGPTDTDRWMWAQAWADDGDWAAEELDEPILGCVVVLSREGGGHVTLFEEDNHDGTYACRGGNQSDMVNVSNQSRSNIIALMWPKGHKRPGIISDLVPEEEMQVEWLQASLNIVRPKAEALDVDGEVGPKTEAAVKDYQVREGLMPTGKADRGTVSEILHDLDAWNTHRPDEPVGSPGKGDR